jgi:tetratricopeptide (TPR) repeat protein
MNRIAWSIALILVSLGSGATFAQEVGDSVVILRETPVKRGKDVLQKLPPGERVRVHDVQPEWLWVSVETTGWIAKKNVGTPEQAIEFFSERIREAPKDAEAHAARGNAKLAARQFDAAIEDYNAALKADPANITALTNRAVAWADKNQVERALADADQVLRINPQSAAALFLRGTLLAEAGQFNKAAADLSDCLRISPDYAAAYRNRSGLWLEMHEYDRAFADANRATELNAKNGAAFSNRGAALIGQGKVDEAFDDFNEAARLDPNDPQIYIHRANAWCHKGDFQQAIADLSTAIKLRPDANTYNLRGHARAEAGDIDKALIDYSAALKLDPADVRTLHSRSTAWMYKHQYAKALDDVNEVLRMDPNDIVARRRRAYIRAAAPDRTLRDGKQAVADAVRACELSQWRQAETISVLAAAYAELGDFPKAVEWESKALTLAEDKNARAEFTSTLKLYQQRQPYRLPNDGAVVPAGAQKPARATAQQPPRPGTRVR